MDPAGSSWSRRTDLDVALVPSRYAASIGVQNDIASAFALVVFVPVALIARIPLGKFLRAVKEPALLRPAVAGAVLSTIATVVEMAIMLAATSRPTLFAMVIPLIASGIVAVIYGVLFTLRTFKSEVPASHQRGRPFSLKTALAFALTIAAVLFISAALNAWFGSGGVIAAGGIGTLKDLIALKHVGVDAAVVGKALYEGKFTLKQAIDATKEN